MYRPLFILIAVIFFFSPSILAQPETISKLAFTEIAHLSEGAFRDIAFTPDYETVAVATTRGIWLYDIGEAGEPWGLQQYIDLEIGGGIDLSPDGKQIAIGSADSIRLWDVDGNQFIHTLQGHGGFATYELDYSPGGKHLVSGGYDKVIRVWDTETGELIHEILGHEIPIEAVTFSKDGKLIRAVDVDSVVTIWDAETFELLQTTDVYGNSTSQAFSFDSNKITTGGYWGGVRVWDIGTGTQIHDFNTCHEDNCLEQPSQFANYNPKQDLVLGWSPEGIMRIWDTNSGDLLHWMEHPHRIRFASFYPDQSVIFASSDASKALTLNFWNPDTGAVETVVRFTGQHKPIQQLRYSPNGNTIMATDGDAIRIWNIETASAIDLAPNDGERWRLTDISYSSDGSSVIASEHNGSVYMWDAAIGELVQTRTRDSSKLIGLHYNPQDDESIALFEDGNQRSLRYLNVMLDELQHEVELEGLFHIKRDEVAYNRFSKQVAALTYTGTHLIQVWDSKTGATLYQFGEECGISIDILTYNPDGTQLLCSGTGAEQNQIIVWDTESGELEHILKMDHPYSGFHTAIHSPNGQWILSGSSDGRIQIWDADSFEPLHMIEASIGRVHSLAFSPDGSQLAAGGSDGTIKIWGISEN